MNFIKTCFLGLLAVCAVTACSSDKEEPVSSSAPKLISSQPANGATNVSVDLNEIVLTFDQNVTVTPIGETTILLNGKKFTSVSYSGNNTVTLSMSGLQYDTEYTVTVPASTVVNSNRVGVEAFTVSFTTENYNLDITPEVAANQSGMTTDAIAWTHKIYAGWNLGNSFESAGGSYNDATGQWDNVWIADRNQWETAWGNPATTEDMIKSVKAAGFNAIRIPCRWGAHVTDEETMTIDPQWLARVKQVVDYCVNNGMYTILNTHHEAWLENHPYDSEAAEISRKETLLWKQIATAFRDYSELLAFSGTNEVNVNWKSPTTENLRVQNGYNQDFINAVRSTGGRNWYRNLIVQTYSANPYYGLSGFEIPHDVVKNRLIVEFHYYDPYDYVSGSVYYWGEPYKQYGDVSTSGQEADVKALFQQISEAWLDRGLGVVMGEYGMSRKYTESGKAHQFENFTYYLKTIVSSAKAAGFAPFVWDNNEFGNGAENFGIFDRDNNMNVRMPEFLNGIMEGAKTNYPN
jgi:endoglucanase